MHEEPDDALRARCVMEADRPLCAGRMARRAVTRERVAEGQCAEPGRTGPEHLPACDPKSSLRSGFGA